MQPVGVAREYGKLFPCHCYAVVIIIVNATIITSAITATAAIIAILFRPVKNKLGKPYYRGRRRAALLQARSCRLQ
jgi:hypothetical protein